MTTQQGGVSERLKAEFAEEVAEHLDHVEKELVELERKDSGHGAELSANIFRGVHSIKGAAGFMGFTPMVDLSHAMETVLHLLQLEEIVGDSACFDALLAATDRLKLILRSPEDPKNKEIRPELAQLQAIAAAAESGEVRRQIEQSVPLKTDHGADAGVDVSAFSLDNIRSRYDRIFTLNYNLLEFERKEGLPLVSLFRRLTGSGDIMDVSVQTEAANFDTDFTKAPLMCRVVFATNLTRMEMAAVAGLAEDQLTEIREEDAPEYSETKTVQDKKSPPVADIPSDSPSSDASPSEALPSDAPPAASSVPAPQGTNLSDENDPPRASDLPERPDSAKLMEKPDLQQLDPLETPPSLQTDAEALPPADTIRMRVDILDKLMKIAGEMVLVRNNLMALTTSDSPYQPISQRLNTVTTELQETVMQTRLQPLDTLFSKLPRIVRDLSARLNKRIGLSVTGNEVELDKTVLEALADPLIHIIRNCCDHGIEPPDTRISKGKTEKGLISIRAWHEAGQIHLEAGDDGAGIDPDRIRKQAVVAGLESEESLARMSDEEILRLIFRPGLSTAAGLSEVSGRGVGMDVVKDGLARIGGSAEVTSIHGQETKFHLRIPLTLAIIPCMIIRSGDHRYAIPQVNIQELLCLYGEEAHTRIEYTGDQEVYRLRDRLIPMVRLAEILSRPEAFSEETRREIGDKWARVAETVRSGERASEEFLNFAVIKSGARRFGLVIDDILGVEEVVVNRMHNVLNALIIYAGATIMGDGAVALILDVDGLARHAAVDFHIEEDKDHKAALTEAKIEESQTVLLFESGPKEQFAIPLPMIRRVERIMADRIECVGEKEYVTVDGVPTLIIRLDHVLEVSPCPDLPELHLLLPKHTRRPYGILMSEVIDTRDVTLYLRTDAYEADGVVGTSVVRDRMTLFLDAFRLVELANPDWFHDRKTQFPAPVEKKKALLAEDTSFFRRLVSNYLENDGYEIISAVDGAKALAALEENRVDVIISDLDMPEMNGWEFMTAVRKDPRFSGIPSLALTALNSEPERQRALACGFDAFEIKLDREALLGKISHLMSTHKGGSRAAFGGNS